MRKRARKVKVQKTTEMEKESVKGRERGTKRGDKVPLFHNTIQLHNEHQSTNIPSANFCLCI